MKKLSKEEMLNIKGGGISVWAALGIGALKDIQKEEMMKIVGGGTDISGAILNAISGCIETIFGIGQAVGSAIRRIRSGNLCKF